MLGWLSKCKASWIKHTVSVWVPVKPHWPFAGEHSVAFLALCGIRVRNTAASTAPSCPKLFPSLQPARHVDHSGQVPGWQKGSPCESFRRGEHPLFFPLMKLVPGTTELCHLPRLQLQLCCHGPGPSYCLACEHGSPNSWALVSLALLRLPSHHPAPAFPWTAGWDGQNPGMCKAAPFSWVQFPFLEPCPWMWFCLGCLSSSFCTARHWMHLLVQSLGTEAVFSSYGKWEWNCLN